MAIETGEKPENKKVIKSSKDKSIKTLIGKENPSQEDYNKFSDHLLENDDEVENFLGDIEKTKIYNIYI